MVVRLRVKEVAKAPAYRRKEWLSHLKNSWCNKRYLSEIIPVSLFWFLDVWHRSWWLVVDGWWLVVGSWSLDIIVDCCLLGGGTT